MSGRDTVTKTRTGSFGQLRADGLKLFSVNPGVDAALALEYVNVLLITALSIQNDLVGNAIDEVSAFETDQMWAGARMIEMAQAVVESLT